MSSPANPAAGAASKEEKPITSGSTPAMEKPEDQTPLLDSKEKSLMDNGERKRPFEGDEKSAGGFGVENAMSASSSLFPSGEKPFASRRGVPIDNSPKQSPLKIFNAEKRDKADSELTKLYKSVVPKLAEKNSEMAAAAAEAEKVDENEPLEQRMKKISIEDALAEYGVTEADGLTSQQVEERIKEYGLNELEEVKENQCLKFLSFMWNPLSWVMEAAALVAILLSNGPQPWLCNPNPTPAEANCATTNDPPDYPDFIGIVALLIINSCIGYYEENQAGKAVDALMEQLTREYKVKRDGKWINKEAKFLVPGDIISIKLGDIIPADAKLLNGEPLKVDQAALTGESLPVTREPGNIVYSGSTVKQGEIEAVIYATGPNTMSGRSTMLVQTTHELGHLQQVLTQIGSFCVVWILIWIIILCAVLYGYYRFDYRRGIDMILVILIGGVPIAMPTVLSVTMAIGVNELAKEQAVVTRITAVEELAGMDILCSDKTGTLTLNHLSVNDPSLCEPYTPEDILLIAALAARRHGDPDAIDRCILECFSPEMEKQLEERYEILKYVPFDPTNKRTEATVRDRTTGQQFKASKGAPQVMINIAHNADEIRETQNKIIDDYASRGYRALGVARSDDDGQNWHFMGLMSLSDPPRPDTKETIQAAINLGVRVIMITGDQVAIGRETARTLGMGLNFHAAHVLRKDFIDGVPIAHIIEEAHGWGEVLPEDKYKVVQALRANGHLVGMTGDGVNDAPALKAADVGIAVADATDAARSAADMVLLTEGLSVIIKALLGSRCIFQRMRNYSTYACCTTIRIVTTFSLLACIWEFTYPPFLILIIAVLNDGTIMTVSTDRVQPSMAPDSWRLFDIFVMAFVLGFYLTLSSLILFYLTTETTFFERTFGVPPLKYNATWPADPLPSPGAVLNAQAAYPSFQLCSLIYLQVSITGQLVIFSTRARGFFFTNRPSLLLLGAFVVAQLAASLIAAYGNASWTQLYPLQGGWVLIAWIWSLIWMLPIDIPKMITIAILEGNICKFRGGIFQSRFANAFGKRGWQEKSTNSSRRGSQANMSRRGSQPNMSGRQRRLSGIPGGGM